METTSTQFYVDGVLRFEKDHATRKAREFDADGTLLNERDYTAEENAQADEMEARNTRLANENTLYEQARTAIVGNKQFLALSSPTNAQTLAQVKALTRQMNGLIRIVAKELDVID